MLDVNGGVIIRTISKRSQLEHQDCSRKVCPMSRCDPIAVSEYISLSKPGTHTVGWYGCKAFRRCVWKIVVEDACFRWNSFANLGEYRHPASPPFPWLMNLPVQFFGSQVSKLIPDLPDVAAYAVTRHISTLGGIGLPSREHAWCWPWTEKFEPAFKYSVE
jgi:hypothetical protein